MEQAPDVDVGLAEATLRAMLVETPRRLLTIA